MKNITDVKNQVPFEARKHKPEELWLQFEQIAKVPRPSGKEQKILAHLKNFCEQKDFVFQIDEVGNIVIRHPGKKGLQNYPLVTLQVHMDMVCEAEPDKTIDFDTDPIELFEQDGWLKADRTTLGADNGVGLAAALALISDPNAPHGPLEILVTTDEERGLTGANHLKPDCLKSKILLNLDSENDQALSVGCAGGIDSIYSFMVDQSKCVNLAEKSTHSFFKIEIGGLCGGHSGIDIPLGRANAIHLLALVLKTLQNISPFYVSDMAGGNKRNAIPRDAQATIVFPTLKVEQLKKHIDTCLTTLKTDFDQIENNLQIRLKEVPFDSSTLLLEPASTNKVINLLLALPHGVMVMSQNFAGKVETSTNLGTLKITDGMVIMTELSRSFNAHGLKIMSEKLRAIAELSQCKFEQSDGYPGWTPVLKSKLLNFVSEHYQKQYDRKPQLEVIHAGLETGIISKKYPQMEMVSFGPVIKDPHSPNERVNIKSVEKFYELLKRILINIDKL